MIEESTETIDESSETEQEEQQKPTHGRDTVWTAQCVRPDPELLISAQCLVDDTARTQPAAEITVNPATLTY